MLPPPHEMMRATQRRGARVHPIPGDVRPGSTDDDPDQMTAFDGTPMHDDGQPTREATTLRGVNPAELLRSPEEVSSRVLQVILERAAAGSRPGARTDEHVVCLAIEGGGLRVNDAPVSDVRARLSGGDVTPEGVIKLSLGRKRHVLLKPM